MDKTNFVLIHGAYGSPQENWLPWLAKSLHDRGFQVTVPSFPTPDGQNPASWKTVFNREVRRLTRSTVLVGHSLGVGFILRLLEEAEKPILGTFLVSGFIGAIDQPEFDIINAPFFEKDFNWKDIRANAGRVFVYNGDNDPYVPLEKGHEIADHLKIELTVIKNGGHINAASGYGSFPRLLEDINSVIVGT